MSKPAGAACNLDCTYCFYLEKESLYQPGSRLRMSDEVLETYIRQQIAAQPSGDILFAWQGGEPTLLGVPFYERAVALQRRYAEGRKVQNAIQTNGSLLDDAWCEFFKREGFLVGVSIDGPRHLHDAYRIDKRGGGTFDRVMAGLRLLQKHGVEFNTLSVIHRGNSVEPLTTYRFLKEIGSSFMQFIPLVDRPAGGSEHARGWTHAAPGSAADAGTHVAPWSVTPEAYGEFLVSIFDEWVRQDVGRVFVQLFDVSLGIWMGYPAGLCLFRETCGNAVALEHNGDVYSCDHFVYPEYRLGNLLNSSLGDLVQSPRQTEFGEAKARSLPDYCRQCDVRFACHGECPKNRFMVTPDGQPGLNYLCAAYKRFFRHIDPAMRGMAWLARHGLPPSEIMTRGVPPPRRSMTPAAPTPFSS